MLIHLAGGGAFFLCGVYMATISTKNFYVPPCRGVRKPTGPPRTFSSNNFSLQQIDVT
jgi:hypothetical protein